MALKRKRVSSVDLSIESLPKNRKELFSFLFKNNRRALFYSGIAILLLMLPIIVCFILFSNLFNVLYQEYISQASQLSGDELTALTESYKLSYIQYNDVFNWVLVACLLISSIGLSGLFTVMRDYSYNEPMYFKHSFFKGVKQNVGQFILINLIFGLLYVLSMHMLFIDINQLLKILPLVLFVFVIVPITTLMLYISTIYNEKYFTILILAIRFYIGKIYLVIPLSLMIICPFILLYTPYFASFLSISICYPILSILIIAACPILLLVYFLCMHSLFDKTINKKNYPEIVNKGIKIN